MPAPVRTADPTDHTGSAPPEVLHVRVRVQDGAEVPDLVLSGRRLWSVREVLGHRIEQPGPAAAIAEHVWQVVLADRPGCGTTRVCELGQAYPSGRWRLRSPCVGAAAADDGGPGRR